MKVAFVSVRVNIPDFKKRQFCEQLKLRNLNRDAASSTGVLQSTVTPETVVAIARVCCYPVLLQQGTMLSPRASPKSALRPK